ncbi:MAG: ribosomal protein S18-alanine N-acetyltransferase [Clostridia bacterium]|nr:ribosomal protein S18-alanine N-acetyltransferase [Clostridia bacterium]
MEIKKLDLTYCEMLAEIDKACMSVPYSVSMFENELKNNTCYLGAFYDGTLIAYGGMWFVADEGQITNIVVIESHRRRGIGKKILNELEFCAKEKGMSVLNLEVRETNYKAISLYEKNGFIRDGFRKNYYKSPTENAVLMSKKIIH